MMYSNRVCERLHDEHMATLALLEKLERFFANNKPPEVIDAGARTLLVDLAVAFENEIWRHFAFEEKYLFDYRSTFDLGQRGSGLTATLLNGHGMPGLRARQISIESRRHETHVRAAFFGDPDAMAVDQHAAVFLKWLQ